MIMFSILSTWLGASAFPFLAQSSGPGIIGGLWDILILFLVILGLLFAGVMVWKRKKNKQFLVAVVVVLFAVWALLTFSGMFD